MLCVVASNDIASLEAENASSASDMTAVRITMRIGGISLRLKGLADKTISFSLWVFNFRVVSANIYNEGLCAHPRLAQHQSFTNVRNTQEGSVAT